MRSVRKILLAVIVFGSCASAYAQSETVHVVTYVEAMPNDVAAASALLKRYRDRSSHEAGSLRTEILQELARPNRFAIIETWRDKAALDAHEQSALTTQFRDQMKGIEDAPYDERITSELSAAQGKVQRSTATLYVVTHVDVIPPGKDDCIAALKAMTTDTSADAGNISYEVLQQTNRGNHFSVLEAWTGQDALDGHAAAAYTRAFRARLVPFAGALYDERIYKAF